MLLRGRTTCPHARQVLAVNPVSLPDLCVLSLMCELNDEPFTIHRSTEVLLHSRHRSLRVARILLLRTGPREASSYPRTGLILFCVSLAINKARQRPAPGLLVLSASNLAISFPILSLALRVYLPQCAFGSSGKRRYEEKNNKRLTKSHVISRGSAAAAE